LLNFEFGDTCIIRNDFYLYLSSLAPILLGFIKLEELL